MIAFLTYVLAASVRSAIPLTLAGLGDVLSERAGVMNLALEGQMLVGAFFGVYCSYYTGSPWLGVLGAMLAAALVGLVMAVMSVTLCANQIVVATAINIVATGITGYMLKIFNSTAGAGGIVTVPSFNFIHIPWLSDIPFLGEVLFSYKPLVYITVLLVFAVHYYLYHTKLGLVHRSVGENPVVADTLGLAVHRIRYGAVILCGALCGAGGAFMSLSNLDQFQDGMISGRGFIAFAAVIFGRWKPVGAFLAALFFGFADAFQLRMQSMQTGISHHLLQIIPYLCTILALTLAIGRSAGPASDGVPYRKENS